MNGPDDMMPCGECSVCGEYLDHRDLGVCAACGNGFHFNVCGAERRAMKDPSNAHSDPHSASDTDTATLVQEREEALQNAAELASMLEATQYANAGAEDAAKRIMALDQEILALKATNARLQEQNAELMRAVKHWKKLAKAK